MALKLGASFRHLAVGDEKNKQKQKRNAYEERVKLGAGSSIPWETTAEWPSALIPTLGRAITACGSPRIAPCRSTRGDGDVDQLEMRQVGGREFIAETRSAATWAATWPSPIGLKTKPSAVEFYLLFHLVASSSSRADGLSCPKMVALCVRCHFVAWERVGARATAPKRRSWEHRVLN